VPVTRISRTAFAWLVGGLATVFLTLVGLAFTVIPGCRIVIFHLARLWGRICTWATGCPLHLEGRDGIDLGSRYVIMANHQSALDIPVLMGVLPAEWRTVFWAKKSLFRIPVLGWAMSALGHMPVDRINRATAPRLVTESADRAVHATSILVFPEETYGPGERLLEFRRGGFVVALKTGLPILPVGIRGTRAALPPGGRLLSTAPIEVRFGQPIATAGLTISDRARLTELASAAVAELAGVRPAGVGASGRPPAAYT
jgi:1-acyl-sn-glycerol-3-phosphate acyltransferase